MEDEWATLEFTDQIQMSCLPLYGYIFSFLFLSAAAANDRKSTLQSLRCRPYGPPIKFPFSLRDHPDLIGYPGFELYCSPTLDTMINLTLGPPSYAAQFIVHQINYTEQLIILGDPATCAVEHMQSIDANFPQPFNRSSYDYDSMWNGMYQCPSPRTHFLVGPSVDCLSVNTSDYMYPVTSSIDVSSAPLIGCTKKYTVVAQESVFYDGSFKLRWTKPSCQRCNALHLPCGFSNTTHVICVGEKPPKRKLPIWIPIVSVIGALLALALISAIVYAYLVDKQEKKSQARIEKFLDDYNALNPARYGYADLRRITGEFKDVLGEGAYGKVYKGKLSSEVFVAVKILNSSAGDGAEFINEVGTMGRIYHVNVVRLVGFCADGIHRALIYEFLPTESLQKLIDWKEFDWKKVREIALGVAKGIEYLHQGCDQRILHLDIKPHNILLDESWNPKISDFGMAKLFGKEESAVSVTAARGTMGYIAPEVYSRNFGRVSLKSDVYSFGMVVMEMVGGRRSEEGGERTTQMVISKWIYDYDVGRQTEDDAIARRLAVVGMSCVQWHPDDRPSMGDVVRMLEGSEDLQIPPNPFVSSGNVRPKFQPKMEVIPDD